MDVVNDFTCISQGVFTSVVIRFLCHMFHMHTNNLNTREICATVHVLIDFY